MQELFPNITTEVVDQSDWIELCRTKSENSVVYLNSVFSDAARIAKEAGNLLRAEFYGLLSQVFSMYYKRECPEEPFGAMMVMYSGRTAVVTDFTDLNLDIFKFLVGKSGDSTVDARLSDVLWIRRKNREDARSAINSYLMHAEHILKIGHSGWIYGFESLERSAQLWKQLGRPAEFKDRLLALVESCLGESEPETNDYFRPMVLKVIIEYGLFTDAAKRQQWTETLAEETMKNKDFEKARRYLELSSEFARINKDKEAQARIKREIVDYFVIEARTLKADGARALILGDRYSKAIEAARRHGGLRTLIDELHLEMNEVQEKALEELRPMQVKVDVTALVTVGRDAVNSVELDEALPQIARLVSPRSVKELRDKVEETIQKHPIVYYFSAVTYNDKGRVVARPTPALAGELEDKEAGILAQLIIETGRQQELLGRSLIESARLALQEKYLVDSTIFECLLAQNPFVPEGREGLYLKGLKAGLYGDFYTSIHILIPQVENSLRHYLEESGMLVTRLESDLTQREHDLNRLLYEEVAKGIFGEDMVFALRVLLVEQLGGNYRNRLAHGLLGDDHFYGGWCNYLWAMTIRMLWLGRLVGEKWRKQEEAAEATAREDQNH
ncbi:MAG: DUF4209 domain-containing protein [Bdellovibrio sp.]|nr:DUF4209 domain-containing protein [Bdellovibrio sp.]